MYMIGALSNKTKDIPAEDVAVMEEVKPLCLFFAVFIPKKTREPKDR